MKSSARHWIPTLTFTLVEDETPAWHLFALPFDPGPMYWYGIRESGWMEGWRAWKRETDDDRSPKNSWKRGKNARRYEAENRSPPSADALPGFFYGSAPPPPLLLFLQGGTSLRRQQDKKSSLFWATSLSVITDSLCTSKACTAVVSLILQANEFFKHSKPALL